MDEKSCSNTTSKDEDGWVTVGTPPKPKILSKNERRRKRRSEKRRQKREEAQMKKTREEEFILDDPILARALAESRKMYHQPKKLTLKEKIEKSKVQINRIMKKLRQIEKLESREESELNDAERKKIARRESFELKLRDEEEIVRDCEKELESQRRAIDCVSKVQFDTKFACPLCYEVMEAAVRVLPCEHTFCRVCIEDALQYSSRKHLSKEKQIEMIRCPICRQCVYKNGKVNTKPARSVRKKISKSKGTCHCGKVVPLSQLREHLRTCGDGTCRAMFGAKPNLGSGFRQPKIHEAPTSPVPAFLGDYDEEAALQAALVESMQLAGL